MSTWIEPFREGEIDLRQRRHKRTGRKIFAVFNALDRTRDSVSLYFFFFRTFYIIVFAVRARAYCQRREPRVLRKLSENVNTTLAAIIFIPVILLLLYLRI